MVAFTLTASRSTPRSAARCARIAPHAAAMRACLAADLGIGIDAIGVKATTTERLGFPGRGEGLAALAVVLMVRE